MRYSTTRVTHMILFTALAILVFSSLFQFTHAQFASTQINYGDIVSGEITSQSPTQTYVFRGQALDAVNITVDTTGTFQPILSLFRTDNNQLLTSGTPSSDGTQSVIVAQELPYTGAYTIFITTATGAGRFTLSLREADRTQPADEQPVSRQDDDPQNRTADILASLNTDRCQQRLIPLQYHPLLFEAALRHAQDIASRHQEFPANLTNTGSDGSTVFQRVTEAGYPGFAVTEVVGGGISAIEELYRTWINQPLGSLDISALLLPNVNEAAMAMVAADDAIYWTMVLSWRDDAPAFTCEEWAEIATSPIAPLVPPQLLQPVADAPVYDYEVVFDWEIIGRGYDLVYELCPLNGDDCTEYSEFTNFPPLTVEIPAGNLVTWQVRANTPDGTTEYSEPSTFLRVVHPPPTLLEPTEGAVIHDYDVVFDWEIIGRGSDIELVVCSLDTGECEQQSDFTNFPPLTIGVPANSEVSWRVRTTTPGGEQTEFSEPVSFLRLIHPPPELYEPIDGSEVYTSEVTLRFESFARDYDIELVICPLDGGECAEVMTGGRSGEVVNVPLNSQVTWRVRAWTVDGPTEFSAPSTFIHIAEPTSTRDPSIIVDTPIPGRPTDEPIPTLPMLQAIIITTATPLPQPADGAVLPLTDTITYAWEPVPGAVRYQVWQVHCVAEMLALSAAADCNQYANIASGPNVFQTEETTITVPRTSRETHVWRVNAINAAGTGFSTSPWYTFSFDLLPPPVQLQPLNGALLSPAEAPFVPMTSDVNVDFAWEPVPDAVSYRIERHYRPPGSNFWDPIPPIIEFEQTALTLRNPYRQTRWRVYSVAADGTIGQPSPWAVFSFGVPTSTPTNEPIPTLPPQQAIIITVPTATPAPTQPQIEGPPLLPATATPISDPLIATQTPITVSASEAPQWIQPTGSTVDENTEVTFRWTPVDGALSYRITLEWCPSSSPPSSANPCQEGWIRSQRTTDIPEITWLVPGWNPDYNYMSFYVVARLPHPTTSAFYVSGPESERIFVLQQPEAPVTPTVFPTLPPQQAIIIPLPTATPTPRTMESPIPGRPTSTPTPTLTPTITPTLETAFSTFTLNWPRDGGSFSQTILPSVGDQLDITIEGLSGSQADIYDYTLRLTCPFDAANASSLVMEIDGMNLPAERLCEGPAYAVQIPLNAANPSLTVRLFFPPGWVDPGSPATPYTLEMFPAGLTFEATEIDPVSGLPIAGLHDRIFVGLGAGTSAVEFNSSYPHGYHVSSIRAYITDPALLATGIAYDVRLECDLEPGDHVNWGASGMPNLWTIPSTCGDVRRISFVEPWSYADISVLLENVERPVYKPFRLVFAPVNAVAPFVSPQTLPLSFEESVSARGALSFPQGMMETSVTLVLPPLATLPEPVLFEATITCTGATETLRWGISNILPADQPPGFSSDSLNCGDSMPFAISYPSMTPSIGLLLDYPSTQSFANFTLTVRPRSSAPPLSDIAQTGDQSFELVFSPAGGTFTDSVAHATQDNLGLRFIGLDESWQFDETTGTEMPPLYAFRYELICEGSGAESLVWQLAGTEHEQQVTGEYRCGTSLTQIIQAHPGYDFMTLSLPSASAPANSSVRYTLRVTPLGRFTPDFALTPIATMTPIPEQPTTTPIPGRPTATPTPPRDTATPSIVRATNTPDLLRATSTPSPVRLTDTPAPVRATNTPIPARPTNTSIPPRATDTPIPVRATNTPIPPRATDTPVPTATNTSIPPSPTATHTPPPTATPIPIAPLDRDYNVNVRAGETRRFTEEISYPDGDTTDTIFLTIDGLERETLNYTVQLLCEGAGLEILRWEVVRVNTGLACRGVTTLTFSADANQATLRVFFPERSGRSYARYTLVIEPAR